MMLDDEINALLERCNKAHHLQQFALQLLDQYRARGLKIAKSGAKIESKRGLLEASRLKLLGDLCHLLEPMADATSADTANGSHISAFPSPLPTDQLGPASSSASSSTPNEVKMVYPDGTSVNGRLREPHLITRADSEGLLIRVEDKRDPAFWVEVRLTTAVLVEQLDLVRVAYMADFPNELPPIPPAFDITDLPMPPKS